MSEHLQKSVCTEQCLDICRSLCTQSNVWTSAEACVHRAMSGHLQKSVCTEHCLDICRSLCAQSNVWISAEVCVHRAMSGHLQKSVYTEQCLDTCSHWHMTHDNLPPIIIFTVSWFNGMWLVIVPESKELYLKQQHLQKNKAVNLWSRNAGSGFYRCSLCPDTLYVW